MKSQNPAVATVAAPADRDAVRAVVRKCVAKVLERDEATIDGERTLVDQGADSFNFVELVVMLERELSVTIARRYGIPDTQTLETFVNAVFESRSGVDAEQTDN
jgi:acyl carrier protein